MASTERRYIETLERFTAAINFEEPDRVPTWDTLNNEELWRRFGTSSDPLKAAVETHRAVGIDVTRFYWWYSGFDWFRSKIIDFSRFMGLRPDEWEMKTKAGTSWINKRPFADVEGLREHLPQPPDEDAVAAWYTPFFEKTIRAFAEKGLVLVGGLEAPLTDAYTYAGIDLLGKAIYLAPELVTQLLDTFEKWCRIRAQLWAENDLGPAFFVGEDIAFGSGLMFAPNFLKAQVFPRIARIMQPLKKRGVKVIFHSDGALHSIMDYLVKELRVDGLNPIEPAAGMDVAKIKAEYGERLILVGNIDVSRLLPSGNPQDVEQAVKNTVAAAAPGGGFCLASSSEIHNAIPVENALTMYQAAHKYGAYPRPRPP